MALASLAALQEAQKLSSGICWWILLTIEHEDMPTPMRLVTPSLDPITSRGNVYSPTRFDVEGISERSGELARPRIMIEAPSGVVLAALQSLAFSPTIAIEVVLENDLNTVQAAIYDLEITNVQATTSALVADLVSSRFAKLPFPGVNMDRKRVAGIFTDVA